MYFYTHYTNIKMVYFSYIEYLKFLRLPEEYLRLLEEYQEAVELGKTMKKDCETVYSNCQFSVLKIVNKIFSNKI